MTNGKKWDCRHSSGMGRMFAADRKVRNGFREPPKMRGKKEVAK